MSSGTLRPSAVGTRSSFSSSRSPRAARASWVRIGMLRSSRLNFGSCAEVSPMVPTRTVVAMSADRHAEVGGAARVGPDRDLGPAQAGGRGRVADARDACAGRARPPRPPCSSAAGLSLTSTSCKRLAGLAAAEAEAQAGDRGAARARCRRLELALRQLALALRHQLHGQRAGAHFAGAAGADARRAARRCRSPPARR